MAVDRPRASPPPAPCSAIHGARMKIAAQRACRRARALEVGLEAADLAPERVALGADVHHAEVLAVEHDQPGARAEHRHARARRARAAARPAPRARSRASSWSTPRRGSRARRGRRGRPARAPRARRAPSPASIRSCASKPPCRASTPISGWPATRATGARLPAALGQQLLVVELGALEALHRRARARARRAATRSGSCQCVVASTIARARAGGSSDLKMPEPTNTPSAPSAIISAASAGVAIPPAQNSTTGRRPSRATPRTRSSGAPSSLAAVASSSSSSVAQAADLAGDAAHVADRLDDVAGAGLALGADHRRALADPPQRLAEVGGAAHERAP